MKSLKALLFLPRTYSGYGFHSKNNQAQLPRLLDEVALPKKGKWSKADRVCKHHLE
jgi:hypothetical protein